MFLGRWEGTCLEDVLFLGDGRQLVGGEEVDELFGLFGEGVV